MQTRIHDCLSKTRAHTYIKSKIYIHLTQQRICKNLLHDNNTWVGVYLNISLFENKNKVLRALKYSCTTNAKYLYI